MPHDTVKDFVASAAHKLQEGSWKECFELISGMKIWHLQAENKQDILQSLNEKIKEAGLLAYVYMTQQYYDSYSIPTLCQMFELDQNTITKVLSRVILIFKTFLGNFGIEYQGWSK